MFNVYVLNTEGKYVLGGESSDNPIRINDLLCVKTDESEEPLKLDNINSIINDFLYNRVRPLFLFRK